MLRRSLPLAMLVILGCSGGSSSSSSSSSGSSGSSGDGGASSSSGASGSSGTSGSSGSSGDPSAVQPLPAGTILYVRRETKDHDLLVARDLAGGTERIVTDLTGDGSQGWNINGYALSPDRRRITIASLYGPTKEDTDTGLATRAIWTLAVDGTDFKRLTPTFPKDAQGRQNFQYAIDYPVWNADASRIIYNFGSYWQENGKLAGGSVPWSVASAGGSPPDSFTTPLGCSVLHPSRNPATGELLFIHSVCIPGQAEGNGLFLYPAAGGATPKKLLASSQAAGNVDVYLSPASWAGDGSGFAFIGGVSETNWTPALLAYDMEKASVSLVAAPPDGAIITSVAVSPDITKILYCLRTNEGGSVNLHLIDLAVTPATDTPLTTDGKSCDPSF